MELQTVETEEKSTIVAAAWPNRQPSGQFGPGNIANPAGPPLAANVIVARSISNALRAALDGGKSEELAQELIRLALHARSEAVRLEAIDRIANRTEGRPVQAHAFIGPISADSASRLAELAERIAPTLDATDLHVTSTLPENSAVTSD